ncbi:Hypothetical predicted protein [Olea europaea subsp. europaea]|uniref:Uncharacterized protein n=1 Tax=Olea europaea subsp. europaea TaxID=158383 RepID=A0A8S0QJW0_OLEEU|nr:Hypothetical predicted protein [Olea europaea subsp. europaea]
MPPTKVVPISSPSSPNLTSKLSSNPNPTPILQTLSIYSRSPPNPNPTVLQQNHRSTNPNPTMIYKTNDKAKTYWVATCEEERWSDEERFEERDGPWRRKRWEATVAHEGGPYCAAGFGDGRCCGGYDDDPCVEGR